MARPPNYFSLRIIVFLKFIYRNNEPRSIIAETIQPMRIGCVSRKQITEMYDFRYISFVVR